VRVCLIAALSPRTTATSAAVPEKLPFTQVPSATRRSLLHTNPELCRRARMRGRRVPLWADELPEQQSSHRSPVGDEAEALADCSPERLLARRGLAPRRRGVALGRPCTRPLRAGENTNAIVPAVGLRFSQVGPSASPGALPPTSPRRQTRSRRVVE
jgi:hypothetical protein